MRPTERPLVGRLALDLDPERDEERLRRLEVLDDDAHDVHALNRHIVYLSRGPRTSWPLTW